MTHFARVSKTFLVYDTLYNHLEKAFLPYDTLTIIMAKVLNCNLDVCIYQPLNMSTMCHKVNFKAEFSRFEFGVFLLLDWFSNEG